MSDNTLVQKHIRLALPNLNFLDDYMDSHNEVNDYSTAIRQILYSVENSSLEKNENKKINLISKDVSIMLEILKLNDEDKFNEAKYIVNNRIQKNTTKKSDSATQESRSSEKKISRKLFN